MTEDVFLWCIIKCFSGENVAMKQGEVVWSRKIE